MTRVLSCDFKMILLHASTFYSSISVQSLQMERLMYVIVMNYFLFCRNLSFTCFSLSSMSCVYSCYIDTIILSLVISNVMPCGSKCSHHDESLVKTCPFKYKTHLCQGTQLIATPCEAVYLLLVTVGARIWF